MKKEKMSLKSIKNLLNRTELKTIMAGSGGGNSGGGCTNNISPDAYFQCHDSTGYTLGSIYGSCCKNTPQALAQCQQTWPYTTYLTGPC
jgi:hypothetical protein